MALQGEHRLQEGVDRPGRHLVVGIELAGQPPDLPPRHRQREQDRVEIAHEVRPQPGLADRRAQRPLGVAALVVIDLVMDAPHPLERPAP
jgi:hypothetical protein